MSIRAVIVLAFCLASLLAGQWAAVRHVPHAGHVVACAVDDCTDTVTADCGGGGCAEADGPMDHDGDGSPSHHHHHHDVGCCIGGGAIAVAHALPQWLCPPHEQRAPIDSLAEVPGESPVFPMDKPPLIAG